MFHANVIQLTHVFVSRAASRQEAIFEGNQRCWRVLQNCSCWVIGETGGKDGVYFKYGASLLDDGCSIASINDLGLFVNHCLRIEA